MFVLCAAAIVDIEQEQPPKQPFRFKQVQLVYGQQKWEKNQRKAASTPLQQQSERSGISYHPHIGSVHDSWKKNRNACNSLRYERE